VRFDRVGFNPVQMLVCQNGGIITYRAWSLYNTTSDELTYSTSSNGISTTASLTTSGADLVVGVWYHVAVDKDSSGKVRIYVNGVMKASDTPANSVILTLVVEPISVGCSGSDDFQNPLMGNIDDVRITARSRYGDLYGDADFTPPGFQFPDHV
jgi:Concanavalin A-like lectin/glucanases superfamily